MTEMTQPAIPGTPVVLTAEQVAQVLQVSLRTVQRLTASGALPHRTIGERAVRYMVADLEAYLAGAVAPRADALVVVVPPPKRGGRKPAKLAA